MTSFYFVIHMVEVIHSKDSKWLDKIVIFYMEVMVQPFNRWFFPYISHHNLELEDFSLGMLFLF